MILSGSKVLTFLLKGIKIENLHDALTADYNPYRISPVIASHIPVTPSCNSAMQIGRKEE